MARARMRTCTFGSHVRRVCRIEWLTLFPKRISFPAYSPRSARFIAARSGSAASCLKRIISDGRAIEERRWAVMEGDGGEKENEKEKEDAEEGAWARERERERERECRRGAR